MNNRIMNIEKVKSAIPNTGATNKLCIPVNYSYYGRQVLSHAKIITNQFYYKFTHILFKRIIKTLAYKLYFLDIFHLLRNRKNLTVAMFHRVLPATDSRYAGADPEWTMSTETFSKCLKFFTKHYNIVSPKQVFSALQGDAKLPPRSLLITFDDGWADTAQYALPILEKFTVSSLIFVAAGALNKKHPFWEECVYSFLITHPQGLSKLETGLKDNGINLTLNSSSGINEKLIRSVISQLDRIDRSILEKILEKLPVTVDKKGEMLSSEELVLLNTSFQVIGGHGMSHQALTKVDNLSCELITSHDVLSTYLKNENVQAMSFPHGQYNENVINQCHTAGYKFLFSSEEFLYSTEKSLTKHPVIGRIHISERAISDCKGIFNAGMLATWMFLRPVK